MRKTALFLALMLGGCATQPVEGTITLDPKMRAICESVGCAVISQPDLLRLLRLASPKGSGT